MYNLALLIFLCGVLFNQNTVQSFICENPWSCTGSCGGKNYCQAGGGACKCYTYIPCSYGGFGQGCRGDCDPGYECTTTGGDCGCSSTSGKDLFLKGMFKIIF